MRSNKCMKVKKEARKVKFYLTVFNLIKEGLNQKQIAEKLSCSKQKISYYMCKLKEKGFIEKKGFGVWLVKKDTLSHLDFRPKKSIRGHAFIWKIKIPKKLIGNLKQKLNNSNINYKEVGKERFPRIFINKRKVWICNKSIVVFENKSFYAKDSINSRKYAVFELISCLRALESKLSINLKPYTFKTSREHYGYIKNELAIQCNKNNEKIIIHDDLEGDWLWVDDSESLGELENGGTNAVLRSKQVQNWFNDHKENNFQVTPSFILKSLGGLLESQQSTNKIIEGFAVNIKSHTKSIKALSKAIPKLTKILKDTKDENNMLKQKRLNEWY